MCRLCASIYVLECIILKNERSICLIRVVHYKYVCKLFTRVLRGLQCVMFMSGHLNVDFQ